jgi:ABC-type nitrate/sulfonate/bicarbonate transport system ATPase subunit
MTPITYKLTDTLVSIKGVNLTLGGNCILHDVNAEIRDIERADAIQGQVVCFLGPSGIGKTRLARIIAGLDQPTSGAVEVMVEGKLTPVRKGIVGVVPQNYQLFDFLTVRQNLAVAIKQHQGAVSGDQLVEYVQTFDLTPHLDKYPIQLSGGTRQRVAIVRQLLCSEHFIIMDEPFSGLDPIMKQRTCDVITKVASMNTINTIIVITHDVTEGMAVADKVWVMGKRPDGGANIREEIDFAALGIAWNPNIYSDPVFLNEVIRVKAGFKALI